MNTTLLSPAKALEIVLANAFFMGDEIISVSNSLHRVVAEDIFSSINSPGFDRSAMDGYAYRKQDAALPLNVIETVAAGMAPKKALGAKECTRIMTGARIPTGADSVAKFENTREVAGKIKIAEPDKNSNIRYCGEDLKIGSLLLAKGTLLRPQEIGLLATAGLAKVKVASQPVVGIVTTGAEVVDPGIPLAADKIYNSNGPQLAGQIAAMSCQSKHYGIVDDAPAKLAAVIEEAANNSQLVLISGGVSKGDFDFVPGVLQKLGFIIEFQQIAMKPGKPTLFATRENILAVGLPGNPVATFVVFELLVKPLLYKMMGHKFMPLVYSGQLAVEIKRSDLERTEYLPVYFDGAKIHLAFYNGSAHVGALCQANALLEINSGVGKIAAGEVVNVRSI